MLFRLLIGSYITYVIIFIFNLVIHPLHQFSTWSFWLPYLILFASSLYLFKKGKKDIRFFILAFGFMLLSATIHTLMRKGIFPDNFYGIYALNIGFVVEVIFLSLAHGDRVRLNALQLISTQQDLINEQQEKEILKDKINRELEALVKKRTQEVEEKNAVLTQNFKQIQELNDKINLMNTQLDRNVWQLQKEIKETSKRKITDRGISYEEFLTVFPSNFSCYKHLENLKWGKGFICKKCANDRWNSNEPHLLRKCTKCDYIESITASTLFHRSKIPIQKAFFIASLVIKNASITTKDLSGLLDLRLNTSGAFRSKITKILVEEKPENFDVFLMSSRVDA